MRPGRKIKFVLNRITYGHFHPRPHPVCWWQSWKAGGDMAGNTYAVTNGCTFCGMCMMECAFGAIAMTNTGAHIDPDRCTGCGRCYKNCASEAIQRVNGKEESK